LQKSLLRVAGTVLGALSALLCAHICQKNVAGNITYLLISYAIAVARGANPINALLGFNLQWGYAAQLFTYTETIIVVEAFLGIDTINALVISRMGGQMLGIFVALICSTLVWVRTRTVTQQRIAEAFECCAGGIGLMREVHFDEAAVEELFQAAADKLEAAQLSLDDAKVDLVKGNKEKIFGPGGSGIEEARNAVDDCRRAAKLLAAQKEWVYDEAIQQAESAFSDAALNMKEEKDFKAIPMSPANLEASWLLNRAAFFANSAGLKAEAEDDAGCFPIEDRDGDEEI